MQSAGYSTPPLTFWQGIAEQFVYFVQAGDDGPVKIGLAKEPLRRVSSLQTGSPVPLRLRHVVPGDHALERALHRRFAEARVAGEWFGDDWTAIILTYGGGVERAAIDASDGGGSPPILTGSEFRSMKEIVELRAHVERMTLAGLARDEIRRFARLTDDELGDQLAAMRATGIYDLRFRGRRMRPTRERALSDSAAARDADHQPGFGFGWDW